MSETIKELLVYLLNFAPAVAVMLITQVIKLPIKKLLTDKIKNNNIRMKVNMVFIVLPFGVAFAVEFLFAFLLKRKYSYEYAIESGAISCTIYEFISRIVRKIKENKDINSETIATDLKNAREDSKKAEQKFKELAAEVLRQTKGEVK